MRTRAGAFLRLRPLLGGAIAAVTGVIGWHVSPLVGVSAIVIITVVGGLLLGRRAALFAFCCATLAGGSLGFRESHRREAGAILVSQALPHQAISGTMLGDAKPSPSGWTGLVRMVARNPFPAATVWCIGPGEPPVDGAEVSAQGTFEACVPPRNPGEFDQREWFEQKGIAATFLADRNSLEVRTGTLASATAAVRKGFREAITAGLPEDSREANVIRAVVIGEYPAHDDEVVAMFRNSGTLHAFSVSGLHVAMVGAMGWSLLGWAGVSRRTAVPFLIVLMFSYAWITGESPPAVRAAWMGAVFLGAFALRRRSNVLNSLGAVLLVTMLWEGRLLFLPGVQLSYGVVAAIGLIAGWVQQWTDRFGRPDSYLPTVLLSSWQQRWYGLLRKGWDSTGVACAAWIGSSPITLWHFGMTTPVSILAAIPMSIGIFALLGVSLVSGALHPLWPGGSCALNRLNACIAQACTGVAGGLSQIPYGNVRIPRGDKPVLVVYDLPYGARACAFMGRGGTVLLDCGDKRAFRRCLVSSLRSFNAEPDSVILSHPDVGHVGGGPELFEAYKIQQVVMPVDRARSKVYQDWFTFAPAKGASLITASAGTVLPFPDGASLEILLVADPAFPNAAADERAAIYRLVWGLWKILLMSDGGLKTERRLMDSGVDLHSDVIVTGHHRHDLTLGDEFLDAVSPRIIVASNPSYPEASQLDPSQPATWRERGIAVFDQGQSGGVSVRVDKDGKLRMEGFVDQSVQWFSH